MLSFQSRAPSFIQYTNYHASCRDLVAGQSRISLGCIGAAALFLPLFVFLPKLIHQAMKADTDAVIDALGKNERLKKVFWTLFVAMADVLAQVVDPVTSQQIGWMTPENFDLYDNPDPAGISIFKPGCMSGPTSSGARASSGYSGCPVSGKR